MPYSQENRLISLDTPLGTDVLLLAGFSGHEAISRLFSFHLDLLTEQGPIDFNSIIGKNVTISLTQSDDTPRYFNGMVSRFALSGADKVFMHYQMEIVPWTWMLTRYADCKIFHNKAVGDIIQQIFSDRKFTDFKVSLSSSYTPMEYCVQYRETDFNFISRLMEHYGIFYFFEHEQGKHTMVIADSASIHQSCPGFDSAGFNLATGGLDADDVVNSWNLEQELRSGMYTLTDYYFETPTANLVASESTVFDVGGNSGFEIFDYPGTYTTRGDGTSAAKLRMQEEEASHLIAHGSGVCRAFTTGYKFNLEDHPLEAMNATYVLTEIQHVATVEGNYTSGDGDAGSYSNHFSCIPSSVPFRPTRLTPKPFVQGPQTALVVDQNPDSSGSAGSEEIWVDKYGRVVVQFPWDRKGGCSCWVRVSQEWAGEGWGCITIPRVGQEVIVSFLEGDPDRPIITGRVYNAGQTVPYDLPANQTRSTFMTRSSKGGSASTYNELRFEDKTGAEQVFIRGQFDMDTQVLHDSRHNVGNNLSLTVGKDQMESVAGDRHEQVTGKHTEKIGGDSNSNVTGNVNQKVGQNLSIQAGQNLYEKSGQTWAHEAGQTIHLKGGMTVVIEAGTELCLKVGGNFIDINPAGVSIVGTMVMINSGGSAGSGPGSSPTSPAAPTDPDKADDGKTGTKLGSGSSPAASPSSSGGAPASSSAPRASSSPKLNSAPASPPVAGAAAAVSGAASQAGQAGNQAAQEATQAAQAATQQAAQAAQQAADQAKQAENQAQQAAQQVEQQAQQAVTQVTQQARQAFQQANQAVQQAQQAVNQAGAQGQAAAQQALSQAQQQAQQTAQAAAQAVQQAQQQAQQVQQQAQQTVAQAQQQAQQAQQAATQAAQQAQQQAQQAAQQAQQQGQQAVQQAQQAAQQAQQQAQQAEAQAKQASAQAQQAAQQAQQQAQQASQQVQQAASGATKQAQQAAQGAQQAASQAINQAQRGF
jgi:type VI secretion system secreted protein VgrG